MRLSGRIIFSIVIIFLICTMVGLQFAQQRENKQEVQPLLGMPKMSDPKNIYSAAGALMFSPVVQSALHRVYVPNSLDNNVSVIDSSTYKVLYTFATGKTPQHVVPSYDLKTLWVLNNSGNSLTPIDPKTGKPGKNIHIDDPYNLYYTPDGRFAIVVSEAHKRLNFYDPLSMSLRESVPIECRGANHMDFTADGLYALLTCEFSGQLVKLDIAAHKVIAYLNLGAGKRSMPQDIRSAPDGRIFFVADMMNNGVFLIDPITFTQIGFIATGTGTHSIYPSRDGKYLYVANRGCCTSKCRQRGPGSVSVIDPHTEKVVAQWPIPGGGSPDMGNVSADGKELWLSGRYDSEVYVFDTKTGVLTHRIPVGRGPHGLTVWPQPGRYSLGHTGNMR